MHTPKTFGYFLKIANNVECNKVAFIHMNLVREILNFEFWPKFYFKSVFLGKA